MSAVEKVKAMMVGEEHVRHQESIQWAVKYRTALMEIAVELDAARAQIAALEHANPEKWADVPLETVEIPTPEPKLSKAAATSIHMKAYWARRKGLTK